jgi:hypothetical protein
MAGMTQLRPRKKPGTPHGGRYTAVPHADAAHGLTSIVEMDGNRFGISVEVEGPVIVTLAERKRLAALALREFFGDRTVSISAVKASISLAPGGNKIDQTTGNASSDFIAQI